MTVIYGIKNCDKVRKALAFVKSKDIEHRFHDYKKEGVDVSVLNRAFDLYGWENVINRKGTTWRNLPDAIKDTMDSKNAIIQAKENASLVKRPLLCIGENIVIGFNEKQWNEILCNG